MRRHRSQRRRPQRRQPPLQEAGVGEPDRSHLPAGARQPSRPLHGVIAVLGIVAVGTEPRLPRPIRSISAPHVLADDDIAPLDILLEVLLVLAVRGAPHQNGIRPPAAGPVHISPQDDAIALPSVGAAILLAGAGDHIAAAAIVADSAAGDVIYNHAAAHALGPGARARLFDPATGLMPGHHALVAFRTLAQMLMIDAADVGPADGRGLHAQQHFAVAGSGNGNVFQFHRAVAG